MINSDLTLKERSCLQISMARLPMELTADVLCRLPAKSVARFNCVSKECASFFSESYFSKRHCQGQRENLKLIVRDGLFYSLDPDSLDCAVRVENPLKDSDFTVKKVLGCSNGLLCLSVSSADPSSYTIPNPNPNPVVKFDDDKAEFARLFCTPEFNDDIIVICNLSTGARHVVPPAPIDFGPEYFPMLIPMELERRFSYGFGFDPSGDDYKLVRISQYLSCEMRVGGRPKMLTEVKVYSTKTKSWTGVDHQVVSKFCLFFSQEPVLVDGALHWLAGISNHVPVRGYTYPRAIVAFNISDCTFHEVPHPCCEADIVKLGVDPTGWPHEPRLVYTTRLCLGAVGGRLCVMCSHFYDDFKVALWKLEGHNSWAPFASFKLVRCIRRDKDEESAVFSCNSVFYSKLFLSNNGNKVLVEQQKGGLICYDPVEGTGHVSQIKLISVQPRGRGN